jgi:hypothetical protein
MPATIVAQPPNTAPAKAAAARRRCVVQATIPPGGCTIVAGRSIASAGAVGARAGDRCARRAADHRLAYPQPRPVYQFSMSTVSSGNLFTVWHAGRVSTRAPARASLPATVPYSQFIVATAI